MNKNTTRDGNVAIGSLVLEGDLGLNAEIVVSVLIKQEIKDKRLTNGPNDASCVVWARSRAPDPCSSCCRRHGYVVIKPKRQFILSFGLFDAHWCVVIK
jgi:hypothetical protein